MNRREAMRKHKTVIGWNIFRRTRELEEKINLFLLNLVEAGVLYIQALEVLTRERVSDSFIQIRDRVSELEAQNDSYRRVVENDLYAHMILPDMRSDILKILEGCDKIINKYQSNLLIVSIESPELPDEIKEDILKMAHADVECVDGLISGVKAFFAGEDVDASVKRTREFEHIVDGQAFNLKKRVYERQDLSLALKLQLKEFIYHIEKISDIAEDVADILKIMAVKHLI